MNTKTVYKKHMKLRNNRTGEIVVIERIRPNEEKSITLSTVAGLKNVKVNYLNISFTTELNLPSKKAPKRVTK